MTKRYIPGLGLDDVAVAYDGSGTSSRNWQLTDERGSVIAMAGSTGAVSNINTYDEYGVPGSGNVGRFQYTGQQWLPEAGAYHYRARTYLPEVGRFLQPDPIGYAAGMNLYAYVGGDPVNFIDPSGTIPLIFKCKIGERRWTEWEPDENGDLREVFVVQPILRDCSIDTDTSSYFEGYGADVIGLRPLWTARLPECPRGGYYQFGTGVGGAGTVGKFGYSGGWGTGISFNWRQPLRTMQFYTQGRQSAGAAFGSGGNVGAEVNVSVQDGPMQSGRLEGALFTEVNGNGWSLSAARGPGGSQAGMAGGIRGRGGLGAGSFMVAGFQSTSTYATRPQGCSVD